MKADKVIFGNIYTVDRNHPKAEAAAITVGKEADLVVLEEDITACDPEHIAEAKVLRTMVGGEWVGIKTTELVRTSQSWDGVELPDYLQGKPEIVGMKYEIPAGQKLGIHYHPVMNFGILVQGDLTIISEDGLEKVVHEGEAIVEMVGTVHHGENRGTKPVVLYMFYLSQKGLPLSVQQ